MVSDFLSTSIEQFQSDCMQLCEQHYPTVHNRGMRENHLGKALCRRILHTLSDANIQATITQCQNEDKLSQPVFHIQTSSFSVWVIAHRLLSANLARRQALINTIKETKERLTGDHPHHLVLVADHWFDRSKASKEIPAWWLGQLPRNAVDYLNDGIRLQAVEIGLPEQLAALSLTEGHHALHHPLRRDNHQKTVYKYILLTSHYVL
ncbi:hypothetical protein ACFFLZ_05795 [Photobacterium aphoticum]|uniref:Uncharacterized protein n=1 Tax=Photobacterium aphoticum TaxID=754436 RepID=A0A0J1JIQ6_9GAMM|nr:hypothetical protein [Photobacterium aphoticum]KLV01902.1 hypothetical protein ABT58_05700 [Photobacterium aphoticum]PSU60135.1 hypothetical protein C9I90_00460 [Photobacterium aphoticum]GHA33422.1 hypothetical protein GCM10007086_03400 [Photobacterium aphoticum]